LKNTEYTYVVVDRSILTPSIRDEKDVHVLQAIIEFNVDILLTGDKDFNEVELEGVEITNLRKFSIINIPDSNILWVIEVWEKLVNHN
jgi:predicted nucleic acid-binding protein